VNREQQVATISRRLKVLAKELKVPLIVLAQLNRKLETREDKRPVLSDLRESGSIEQDADKVCFLYRDPSDIESQGVAEFLVRKNRVGVSFGSVKLGWISCQTRFTDYIDMAFYAGNSATTGQRLGARNF
jgi:replicative DNA helicase